MNPPEYPTPWQKKSIWAALTTLAVVAIGATAVGLIWLFSTVIAFLQPILIPFAVAGVLAYLFEPVVARIVSWGTSRRRAVLAVFAVVTIALTGILIWIIPAIWTQTGKLVHSVPAFKQHVAHMVEDFNGWALATGERLGFHFPQIPKKIENPLAPATDAAPVPETPDNSGLPPEFPAKPQPGHPGRAPAPNPTNATNGQESRRWPPPSSATTGSGLQHIDLQKIIQGAPLLWTCTVPIVTQHLDAPRSTASAGFLGVIGPLLSMIIVPASYLYYFLIESKNIADSWSDYLPLRASAFKDEVIATLEEINGYLIAFFRGQLLVSMINGTVTGILLVACGLEGGMLIGLMLCFLGIIPYLGIILCWVPAVLIAVAQGGAGTWIPGDPWYLFPLVVTVIFFLVQQVDGFFHHAEDCGRKRRTSPDDGDHVGDRLVTAVGRVARGDPGRSTDRDGKGVAAALYLGTPVACGRDDGGHRGIGHGVGRANCRQDGKRAGKMNPPPAKTGRVIVPSTARRDALIGGIVGLLMLAFVGYGIMHMAAPVTGNKLTGTVLEKVFTPRKERQVSFDGRRIEGTREIAGEYLFKVRVEAQKRTYEVPVEQQLYEAKQVGDSVTFLRPESEQR